MHMQSDDIDGGVTLVRLDGAMDIAGVDAIDLRFSTLAGSRQRIVIDLEKVTFLASIGIRTLIVNARTVKRRGGQMVIANPPGNVAKALKTSGIDQLILVYGSMEDAIQAVGAA